MKVVISSHGKFHYHDMARELDKRGVLERFYTGYPRWKLHSENLPLERVHTFPWIEAPYMAFLKTSLMGRAIDQKMLRLLFSSFDNHVAKTMPETDVYIGLSGAGLRAGKTVKDRGGLYVCDRGSSHITFQDAILREEWARQGVCYPGIDQWIIDREMAEYDLADLITVPSDFVRNSFIKEGVPPKKLVRVPYGVDLDRFKNFGLPPEDAFNVIFIGSVTYRKGIPDLLKAFDVLEHSNKTLTVVGGIRGEMQSFFDKYRVPRNISLMGHVPQHRLKEFLNRAHVLVLPSVEEGLALVMAQAMACGCPVIASENTGASDLFADGVEGYIVPIRSPEILASRLQELADNPGKRNEMAEKALARVKGIGGWQEYGDRLVQTLECRC